MFPKNHAILVLGGVRTGMSEFCSYLGSTYLLGGEKVVFVEANNSPTHLRRQMRQFGVEPLAHEADRSLVIIDLYTPYDQAPRGPGKPRPCRPSDLTEVTACVRDAIIDVGGSPVRVLFDSLTPLFANHEVKAVAEWYGDLVARVKLDGSMTSVAHEDILDPNQLGELEKRSDGVLEMKVDQNLRRFVRIRFMRGLEVTPRWVPFEFEYSEATAGAAFLSWKR